MHYARVKITFTREATKVSGNAPVSFVYSAAPQYHPDFFPLMASIFNFKTRTFFISLSGNSHVFFPE
jgi:hypothetical protein